MFYSLRFGILMAMLAVAAVAIATITIFVGFTTRLEFSRYVELGREIREERLQDVLIVWADSNEPDVAAEQFEQLQRLTEGLSPEERTLSFRSLGTMLTTSDNTPIVPDDGDSLRFRIAPDGSVTVMQDNAEIGTLYVDPVTEYEMILAQRDFVDSVTFTLWVTAIVAGVAAVALTVILSRRILHPVAALTLAARRMESGDLDQRVHVHASGEISELAHAFNAMAETLKHNEDLRRNMVSDIAHELRTPLTNIRGYLEAIQDDVLQADTETIDLLTEEATLLHQLVNDLQELSLAEAGQLHFETQAVALDMMIEQAISALQPTASAKQITLSADLPPQIPPVCADQRRVMQVLRNLISNAITHTPPQGQVAVVAQVYPAEIEVTVRDTGDGIEQAHLPYLFERFYRADPSRNRATGGAGLGLAIVKQLIEKQGGRVRVVSEKGAGAAFSFTLPRTFDAESVERTG